MEYECDGCGEMFEVSDETFIGELDGGFTCDPFIKLDHLCERCYQKHQKPNV